MERTDNIPNRCQHLTGKGQCPRETVEGYQYCDYHLRDRDIEDKLSLRAYHLTNSELSNVAGRHSQVEELKSLREEIIIARTMIEKRLNMVESNADFLSACGTVNSYLLTLERLTNSFHRMEVNLGNLLSKGAIFELAKEIVNILMTELAGLPNHEEIVDRISERIVVAITEQTQKE